MSSSFVFFFFWGMGAERTSWGGRGEPVAKAREATPEVARRVRNNFSLGGMGRWEWEWEWGWEKRKLWLISGRSCRLFLSCGS